MMLGRMARIVRAAGVGRAPWPIETSAVHNPNRAAAVDAWPMAVVGWSVLMLLVFAPLAVRQFRRKVLG